MTNVPELRQRGERGAYKLGKKLRRALQHLTDGRPLPEAAALARMTPQGLKVALRKPHVLALVSEDARARLSGLLPKACATIEKVMDGDNAQAALNAARLALGIHEIAPPEKGGAMVSLNIGIRAGYVLDLRDHPAEPLPDPSVQPRIPRQKLQAVCVQLNQDANRQNGGQHG
jgi:hypothetical protein